MATPEPSGTALRDGRCVTLAAATAVDAGDVARLLEQSADPRSELFARAAARGPEAQGGELVARSDASALLVAYGAWFRSASSRCEFVCAVDASFTGIGLGTLLLRTVAADALAVGVRTLRVEVHPGARALAAMLRDCGLRSHWDLEHPIARIELMLDEPRPGWTTP